MELNHRELRVTRIPRAFCAPAVQYPLGRSRWAGLALLTVAALGLVCTLAWLLFGQGVTRPVAGLLVWMLCAAAAWNLWRCLPQGPLVWSGKEWSLPQSGALQWPCVYLDMQTGLLLLLRSRMRGERPIWLWLERDLCPDRWHALRCAVHAPPPRVDSGTGQEL